MNVELKELMIRKDFLDEEIDRIDNLIERFKNEKKFDRIIPLEKTREKLKHDRAALRPLIQRLIVKPGYIWEGMNV